MLGSPEDGRSSGSETSDTPPFVTRLFLRNPAPSCKKLIGNLLTAVDLTLLQREQVWLVLFTYYMLYMFVVYSKTLNYRYTINFKKLLDSIYLFFVI